jgi:hypothetical protein
LYFSAHPHHLVEVEGIAQRVGDHDRAGPLADRGFDQGGSML